MPQVSLYIDRETLVKIEHLAQKSHISLSKWVGNKLKRIIKDDYPEDFFDLFGSAHDGTLVRPESVAFGSDTGREKI